MTSVTLHTEIVADKPKQRQNIDQMRQSENGTANEQQDAYMRSQQNIV